MNPETPDRDAPSDDLRAMMVGAATLLRSAMRAVPNAAKLVDGESATPSLWLDVPPEVVRDLEPEEAMVEVCALLLERLFSRENDCNVKARQVTVMDRLGRLMVRALAPGLPDPETDILKSLTAVDSSAASEGAMALIKRDRRWLLHPLVIVQLDRWRMAYVVRKRAGYLPKRFEDLKRHHDTQADRLDTFVDLLQKPAARTKVAAGSNEGGKPARSRGSEGDATGSADRGRTRGKTGGEKVNVDAFQEVHRQVQMEIARVRGVFEEWVASGDAGPPELIEPERAALFLRKWLRTATWLADSTLQKICGSPDGFPDEGCIVAELFEQYKACRRKLKVDTVRRWVGKHIDAEYRPIPKPWIPQVREQPLAMHFKPGALSSTLGSGRKEI